MMIQSEPTLDKDGKLFSKHFEPNVEGRDFIVGDIHGEITKFNKELERHKFDKTVDRMFSVGDLIDRGENSYVCMCLVEQPWFHSVRGNHEQMMIDYILGTGSPDMWVNNGGGWHRAIDEDEMIRIATLALNLPYSITIGEGKDSIGVCHAQPPTTNDWNDVKNPDSEVMMLWGRTRISMSHRHPIKNIGHAYHGHTPLVISKTLGNTTFLDTGACFGDKYPLTILQINGET